MTSSSTLALLRICRRGIGAPVGEPCFLDNQFLAWFRPYRDRLDPLLLDHKNRQWLRAWAALASLLRSPALQQQHSKLLVAWLAEMSTSAAQDQ